MSNTLNSCLPGFTVSAIAGLGLYYSVNTFGSAAVTDASPTHALVNLALSFILAGGFGHGYAGAFTAGDPDSGACKAIAGLTSGAFVSAPIAILYADKIAQAARSIGLSV